MLLKNLEYTGMIIKNEFPRAYFTCDERGGEMKVKLKNKAELLNLGYELIFCPKDRLPKGYGRLANLVRPDGVAIGLDLDMCDDLTIVPKNTLTEETYEAFKDCFEVIK